MSWEESDDILYIIRKKTCRTKSSCCSKIPYIFKEEIETENGNDSCQGIKLISTSLCNCDLEIKSKSNCGFGD